jgi:drug/metabolite transporter (DMT)-like permease
MSFLPSAIRGPLFMVVATGSYLINDSFLKLATVGLPPYEALFLRGVAAAILGLPLLYLLGHGKKAHWMFEPRVLLRNLMETGGILSYVIALAHMPIADVVALGQITPLLVILGSSILFREKIGGLRMALIGLGFIGALMVAQPGLTGISTYALLAMANAVFCAARDLTGRRVGSEVPGMIVAISAVLVVMIAAGIAHVLTEEWVAPSSSHLPLLAGAGFFLIFGHFFIFIAYRIGPAAVVAPFYYTFSVWAVISGLVVFGEFPNTLALLGILLIVGSGLVIVMLDRRRKPIPAA